MTTKVIFRVDERDGGYEVIAVFPEIAGDMNPRDYSESRRESMKNVIVIKSLTRKYGYSLQWVGKNPPSWIMGANHTFAWFRYKRDALKRAEIYNDD